jgi:ribosomal-protein-alanine N-acetyltransferase
MGVATMEVVIVKMSERGQGIGKMLIKHVIDEAEKKGCHVIKLETGVSWQARLVYEKMGFHIRAVLPNYYGNQEYILMDMKLGGEDF